MRRLLRFSYYKELNSIFSSTPKSLFKLKRVKWDRIKKNNFFNKSFVHINPFCVKKSIKFWDKITSYKRDHLIAKRGFSKLFSGLALSAGGSDIQRSRHNKILFTLGCPFFQLDFVLFIVGFCSTVYEARRLIKEGFVFVNSKVVFRSVFLKGGDRIFLKSYGVNSYTCVYNKYCFSDRIFSFFEVDFYSQEVFVLKSFNDLTVSDLTLLSLDSLDMNQL
jgi:hypothetical protein